MPDDLFTRLHATELSRRPGHQAAMLTESTSHWWAICCDCWRMTSFAEGRLSLDEPEYRVVDGALLLAALDLAEHQADSGHRRCVLWTGSMAHERPPDQYERAVCAGHPAYVIPRFGGRWHPAPPSAGCVLTARLFEVDGTLMQAYPLAVPAWVDSRHGTTRFHAGMDLTDRAYVCTACACEACRIAPCGPVSTATPAFPGGLNTGDMGLG